MLLRYYFLLTVVVAVVVANKQKTTKTTPKTTTTQPDVPAPTTTKTTTTKATTQPDVPQPNDASAFCLQCRSRYNHKDLYADPTNCHFYYACFYYNDTFATGIRRPCPAGTFWHDQILQCMPEGATPCVDRCLDDVTANKGCYAGTGCRQFYICANTASYGMCCPVGSRFVESTCACEESETCEDACIQAGPQVGTTVAPARSYNATVCQDSFGTYIAAVAGTTNAYSLIDDDGHPAEIMYCPTGVTFDLTSCRCDIVDETATPASTPTRRQATLWIPFDADWRDHSHNAFVTFLYDGAERDAAVAAYGSGSLWVNGGHLSIPGLKTYDSGKAGSWCAHFRCESGVGFTCTVSGGILSNNKDITSSEFTIILGNQGSNTVTSRFNFWHPVGTRTLNAQISTPSNGWNHVCQVYDGEASTIKLYLNGQLAASDNVGGALSVAHCPYVIGNDQGLGTFTGHIDEVLITPFAMTTDEINAHRTGDRAYLISRGFFSA